MAGFDFLIQKYRKPIIHFMYRMVHNQAVAEELAQEVFLRVYRSRETYRAEARFSTWLYRIATNLGVNYARDTRHERTASTVYLDETDSETGTTPDVADTTPSAESNLLRRERLNAIREHVLALPERQRMAVLMHKYEGIGLQTDRRCAQIERVRHEISAVSRLSDAAREIEGFYLVRLGECTRNAVIRDAFEVKEVGKGHYELQRLPIRFPRSAARSGAPGNAAARSHIESCAECHEEFDSLEATFALLDTWKAPEPSPTLIRSWPCVCAKSRRWHRPAGSNA